MARPPNTRLAAPLAAAFVFLQAACGPHSGGDTMPEAAEQADTCPQDVPAAGTVTESRTVSLGHKPQEDFVALADGGALPVVVGAQGGTMITPWVQLSAADDDSEYPCFLVTLNNSLEGPGEVDPQMVAAIRFVHEGDMLLSGAIFDVLSFDEPDLGGQRLRLGVKVQGTDFEETTSVLITLQ